MKTLKLIITAICVSVLALLLLGAECGLPVETLPPYYIIFKVDGESKTFDKGFTNYESNPFGQGIINGGDYSELYATPDEETGG